MPHLVVIGGPNGSGKTTLTAYLVKRGRVNTDIINPDDIAKNEFGGYRFHIQAARIALARRQLALNNKTDFAFETTLSGNSEINSIIRAKNEGYQITLYYIALESVLDNIIRVEERGAHFGHHVTRADVIRRHENSKANIAKNIALFDQVYLYDNSESARSRVAIFNAGNLVWLNTKHENHPFYQHLFSPLPTLPPLQG